MSKQPTLNTPPESFINPPLTPPLSESKPSKPSSRVSNIIGYLRLRKTRQIPVDQPWTVFQLVPGDFGQLVSLLKVDEELWSFVENQIQYDYFSRSNRLIIRVPSNTHEFFVASVVSEIHDQLKQIAAGTGEVAEIAKEITHRGSPKLQFPVDEVAEQVAESNDGINSSTYDSHEPDAAFKHSRAHWPCLVIEVSFSQKRKDLKYLAEDYILGSDGNIRVVVGIDIEYSQSKKASFSVWQPQYVYNEDGQAELISAQVVVDEEFRDDLGNPTETLATGLGLQLKRFGIEALDENAQNTTQFITIPSSLLFDFVVRAESDAEDVRARTGSIDQLIPGARKRRRQKTPLEELESVDERIFLEQEEKDAKRTARMDDDYV